MREFPEDFEIKEPVIRDYRTYYQIVEYIKKLWMMIVIWVYYMTMLFNGFKAIQGYSTGATHEAVGYGLATIAMLSFMVIFGHTKDEVEGRSIY